jgi:hypothetical protein
MFHLVQTAVNPPLVLEECVENWHTISQQLREPHRRRLCRLEDLTKIVSTLS